MAQKEKTVITDVESEVANFVKSLEGKTEAELKRLYDEAIVIESGLKVKITVLRQRAANMASHAESDAERAIIDVKNEWLKSLSRLKALEKKLFGVVKDYSTGETFHNE